MSKLLELDKDTYDNFVKNHKTKSHFLQSYCWGVFSKKEKNLNPYYLGIVNEQKEVVGAALLLQKMLPLGFCYFYVPRGYVIDYKNMDLVQDMTIKIHEFAKKKKAIFVKIDPDVSLHKLDNDGHIQEDAENNYQLVDFLKKIGYRHRGFNKNFEGSEPRYTFRLNLTQSMEDIEKNFHPTTRKIIHRGNPFNLVCYKNADAKIEDFYLTMIETAKREQVVYHDLNYYKTFYELLHKNNQADLYVVEANIKELKKLYKDKIDDAQKQLSLLEEKDTSKSKNKIEELKAQQIKNEKEYQEICKIKDKKIILSSILTAKYGNKVWTVHGGNHTLLRFLNANYFIYYTIIKDAKEEGYEYIDFFGTTGNPTKDNPIYGIHLFKKRLGGEYLEFIGEFDYVIKPFMYFLFQKLVPCYRNIIKKRSKKELNDEVKGNK